MRKRDLPADATMALSESFFQLPEEIILSPLFDAFPGREVQIRALSTLFWVGLPTRVLAQQRVAELYG